MGLSIEEKQHRILYPVTRVRAKDAGGSGVLIYSEPDPKHEGKWLNFCLTCEHVVSKSVVVKEEWDAVAQMQRKREFLDEVTMELFDYDGSHVVSSNATKADIIGYDTRHDIALVKLHDTRKKDFVANIIPEGDIEGLEVFEGVYVCGCSLLHDPFQGRGELTYLKEVIENKDFIMSSASSVFGNSGGGLFRESTGELLGLTSRVTAIQLGFGMDVMCYDSETEVLTKNGWKKFPDAVDSDEFATLNPETFELEYQKSTAMVDLPFDGELCTFKGTKFDLMVTPNHNMFVSSYNRGKIKPPEFVRADAVNTSRWLMYSAAKWNCAAPVSTIIPKYENHWVYDKNNNLERLSHMDEKEVPINSWLSFLGFYISNGHLNYINGNPASVTITQSKNSSHYDKIISTIQDMGYTFALYGSGYENITVRDSSLATYLSRYGENAQSKHLTDDEKELAPHLLDILIEALIGGEGSRSGKGLVRYTTTSEILADDIQEILMKTGRTGYIHHYKSGQNRPSQKPYISITISNKTKHYVKKAHIGKVPYQGRVYCATVPNHTLYVRRNGIPIWCGNTWMNFSSHPSRLYDFFREQECHFIFDPEDDYYSAMERREKKKKEALRNLLIGPGDQAPSVPDSLVDG